MAFIDVSQLIMHYRYAALVPGVLLFGPATSIVAGFLIRTGYIDLLPTCLTLAGGELASDVVWYWLGRRYGHSFVGRFGRYFGINDETVSKAKRVFHLYHDWIIFISKLTAGFGFAPAIFFTAGLSHVPFRRYMVLNVAGQIVWTGGLLAVGYFLGHLYSQIGSTIEKVLSIGFILFVLVALFAFARFMRGRLERVQ